MNKRCAYSVLFVFFLIPCATCAASDEAGSRFSLWPDFNEPGTIWAPQLFVEGAFGTDVAGAVEFTLPFTQDPDSLLFTDVRFRVDDNSSVEANIGLAYRHALNDELILGGYGFFDALNSPNDNTFLQATIGVELFTEDWRARANGYIPFGKTTHEISSTMGQSVDITGNSIALIGSMTEEGALPGFDVELGRRLNVIKELDQFWIYAGYFHFQDSGFDTINGPRFRAEWFIDTDRLLPGSRLELGGEFTYDSVREDRAFFIAVFRIPLGGTTEARRQAEADLGWRYWAMQTRIIRDADIVTSVQTTETRDPAINPATGDPYTSIYFAEAGATGSGTEDDPTDIDTAVEAAGPGGIVVVNGEEGEIDTEGVMLVDGMAFVGGGTTLVVGTEAGLTVDDEDQILVPVFLPGTRPTVNGTGDDLITIADGAAGVLIQNVDLMGSGNAAILGTNNANLTISNVNIDEPGNLGVSLSSATELIIDALTINEAGGNSLILDGVDGEESSIANVTITEALDDAVVLTNLSGEIRFSNITVQTVSGIGIQLTDSDEVIFTGTNSVDARGGAALLVSNTPLDAMFSQLSSEGSASAGVALDNVSGEINVTGTTTVENSAEQGVVVRNISEDGTEINFGAINVTDPEQEGLLVEAISADRAEITFGNVAVEDADLQGVRIEDVSGTDVTVQLGQVQTEGTELAGIEIRDVTGQIDIAGASITDTDDASGIVVGSVTDVEITFGSIDITDADGDGIRLTSIDGSISFDNVDVDGADGSGVVITDITADDVEIILDDINVSNVDETGVVLTNLSGQDIEVELGDVNVEDAQQGLIVNNITSEGASITISDVDVTRVEDDGVVVTSIASNDSSIEIGDIDAVDIRQGLVVDDITAEDVDITIGDVAVSNADDDAVVLMGLSGANSSLELGNVAVVDAERGLVIDDITVPDASITIGSVNVNTTADDAIFITGLTGDNGKVELGNLTLRDVQRGLVVDTIEADNAEIIVGDINVTDAADDAVLVTNVTGVNSAVELGDLDLQLVQRGLVIENNTGDGVGVLVGDIDVDEATDDGVVLGGLTGINSTIQLGDIDVQESQRGLALLDLNLADGVQITVGDVNGSDVDDQAFAIINLSGGNGNIDIGDVAAETPGLQGILINNVSASDFEMNVGNVNVDEPGAQGVLIDGVSGDNVGMFFGDTVVTDPVGEAVEQINITGTNVVIEFESITTE